jgi:hypothetical protein
MRKPRLPATVLAPADEVIKLQRKTGTGDSGSGASAPIVAA